MKEIKIRSGGIAYLLEGGEIAKPNEICFTEREWNYTKRLSKAIHDPDQLKLFWEGIMEGKKAGRSVLDMFPVEGSAEEATSGDTSTASANPAQGNEKQNECQRICAKQIEKLQKGKTG